MPFISKITLPSGSVYDIKDAQARSDISELQASLTGKVALIGETTTELSDQATTNPIKINNVDTTAVAGNIVYYNRSEYLFDGTKWILLGDLSALGDLAYKDTASMTYTPAGTVSKPTFTGSESSVAITAADDANGNYEPKGTVSAPSISVKTAGSTTTVNSITGVGTLPALGTTVADENLTLTWDAGTLPTKGADTSVKTGDAVYQASAPSFTGTKAQLSGTTTAAGSVSQPAFNGTQANIEVS